MRILITGASGAGTTTLAMALARTLRIPSFDTDDYFWHASDPPYRHQRSRQERLSAILADLSSAPSALISGSVSGWGAALEEGLTLIVFLILDKRIRVARLLDRERARLGREDPEFMEWAGQYDEGRLEGRSRSRDEAWLAARSCPVLRLEGDLSVTGRVARVMDALSEFMPRY
jgi:adenylate kinase family enzyme